MAETEAGMSALSTIAKIRDALGVGAKPMLADLPGIVKRLRDDRDELLRLADGALNGRDQERDTQLLREAVRRLELR